MNLLKRWRHDKRDGQRESGRGTALAKRPHGQDLGLTRFRDEIDQLFERAWRDFASFGHEPWSALSTLNDFAGWPAVDTAEDENSYTVRIDVPGMDPKDVELEVSGNVLTIRGSRRDEWGDENKRRGVIRRERRSGTFLRSVPLPDYVDADRIEARHENGTLTITAPKIPGKGPRRVPLTA